MTLITYICEGGYSMSARSGKCRQSLLPVIPGYL